MKALLWVCFVALALACGDGAGRSQEGKAAAQEEVDEGAGEEISPQLEMDSTDTRFEVDTISSSEEAQKESEDKSF